MPFGQSFLVKKATEGLCRAGGMRKSEAKAIGMVAAVGMAILTLDLHGSAMSAADQTIDFDDDDD